MKKILSIVLSMAVLSMFFVGCEPASDNTVGGTGSSSVVSSSASTEGTSTATSAGTESSTATSASTSDDASSAVSDLSNTTVVGKVTAVDATTITIQIGKLSATDGAFTAEDEIDTITVGADTQYSSDSTDGGVVAAVSDIAVDDVVEITVGSDNVAAKVTVKAAAVSA